MKNNILTERENKELKQNYEYYIFNSTINEFKDIDLKKIFIKKQLKINNGTNTNEGIKVSNTKNDLRLYKPAQVKKKLFPQISDLLSPKLNNTISKSKRKSGNYSIDNCNSFMNLSKEKIISKINIKKDNKYEFLLNSIQVNKKNNESTNHKNENNKEKDKTKNISNDFSFSQNNKIFKLKNNDLLNYIKKKVIIKGKNENNINKNITINKNNLTQNNIKSCISVEIPPRTTEKFNRNPDILNNYLNYVKTEENQKLVKNFKLKKTFLLNQKKIEDIPQKMHIESTKHNKRHHTETNLNNSYKKIDTKMMKEKHDNYIDNNFILNQTMNPKINNKSNQEKEKEKRRYIYINRKIRYPKNDTKLNDKNKNKNKQHILKTSNKQNNKIMEIKVDNGNSNKLYSLTKENNIKNNSRYSLSDRKKDLHDIKFKINQKLNSKICDKKNKTGSEYFIRPFHTLYKFNKLNESGDSINKLILSGPTSARNLGKIKKIDHIEKYNKLTENYNKRSTFSNLEDYANTFNNSMVINNKYFKKHILKNLNTEDKNNGRQNNHLCNTEKQNVRYTSKITNNNTYNTTVNFYKINQMPIDKNNNTIIIKNILYKANSNKNVEHKRNNSDNSSYSNKHEKIGSTEKKIINQKKNSSNSNKNYRIEKNEDNQYINNDIDYEILYILEAKLKSILSKINRYTICYNECFDWINYYFSCNFYEKEISMFKLNHNKNNIIYYIKIELLCYFLCYDVSYNKNFNQAGILFKSIFNLLHINFLILISFIINSKNNNDALTENDDDLCLNRLKEIINKDLKLKLGSQDMNENCILLLISNNFKEINNYYKMIIDNLYSYYYTINDDNNINKSINKFPNCLSLNINSLNNIQKSNIISLFFFDTYKLSNNYNIQDLKIFFDMFLYKSKKDESLLVYNNTISFCDNNINNDNNDSNKYMSNYYNNNTYYGNNQINNNDNNQYILGQNNNNNSNNNIIVSGYYLPPIKKYYKYTLVLDLDETLIYFQKYSLNSNYNNNKNTLILRPGLYDFLYKMKPLYELVLFSFGTKDYVDYILSIIEKKEKIFEYVLYREHATYEKGDYVKNLALLGRDLKKTIIVDDIPRVFKLQKNNGINIKPFYGDVVDDRNTLKLLGIILEKIRFDAEENDGDIRNSLQKQRNLIFTHITTNLDN